MKNKQIFVTILLLIGAILFVAHRLYARSNTTDPASSPVRSDLRQSSESIPHTDCVFGNGYCYSNGYITSGIHIKQQWTHENDSILLFIGSHPFLGLPFRRIPTRCSRKFGNRFGY